MPIQVTVEMPDDALSVLRKSPEDFAREMKFSALCKWYELGLVSQVNAAHLAGLSQADFSDVMHRYEVSSFQSKPEPEALALNAMDMAIATMIDNEDWSKSSKNLYELSFAERWFIENFTALAQRSASPDISEIRIGCRNIHFKAHMISSLKKRLSDLFQDVKTDKLEDLVFDDKIEVNSKWLLDLYKLMKYAANEIYEMESAIRHARSKLLHAATEYNKQTSEGKKQRSAAQSAIKALGLSNGKRQAQVPLDELWDDYFFQVKTMGTSPKDAIKELIRKYGPCTRQAMSQRLREAQKALPIGDESRIIIPDFRNHSQKGPAEK